MTSWADEVAALGKSHSAKLRKYVIATNTDPQFRHVDMIREGWSTGDEGRRGACCVRFSKCRYASPMGMGSELETSFRRPHPHPNVADVTSLKASRTVVSR